MLHDDLHLILEELPPEVREELRRTPETELIRYHRSLGKGLRNAFRQGRFPTLLGHCRRVVEERGEPMSFDALSSVAVREVWRSLQPAF